MAKLIKLWILGSTACVSAGWILSALHQLNRAGYTIFFFVLGVAMAAYVRHRMMTGGLREGWVSLRLRRFRRPLPLLFLLTAALATIGGAVHAPNNYDALTYRFPRLLHWWAASSWHWIATPNERMNLSGTDFEWLMMPLFVLTHSDRLFFLLNIVAYLLLPGLVFAIFVASGMARRVAWYWMWAMPAALCYAMQAGSISNDTIAVTYFLSALFFAFHARKDSGIGSLWLCFLSAALLTGVKASNLPLLLPVAWAMWPALRLMEKRFAGTVAVVLLSLLVSYVPTAYLNQRYTGDWSGDPSNSERIKVQKPLAGILGNGLQLGLQSLEPPFLPLARSAENWVWERFPEGLRAVLSKDFPRFLVGFRELPQEESSGLGIGITLIAIASVVTTLRFRSRRRMDSANPARRQGLILGALTWIALLVYMSKLGSEATSRLIAAYYPLLLLPLLLSRAQGYLVRQKWYGGLAICASLIALIAVVLTPSRPLWPAETFFDWAVERFPRNELMAHAKMVYAVYRNRNDLFAGLRSSIPATVPVIGLIEGGDDAETSLWRPFGARQVVHVLEAGHVADWKLEWLVVKDKIIGGKSPEVFDEWLRQSGGVLVTRQLVREKAGVGSEQWSVVHFPAAAN